MRFLQYFFLFYVPHCAWENGLFSLAFVQPSEFGYTLSENESDYIPAAQNRAKKQQKQLTSLFSVKDKFILASFGFRANTDFARIFHRNIKKIKVHSLDEIAEKVKKLMEENPDKMIRHPWFDSHGKYKYDHVLFNIGRDTLSINNINDPNLRGNLNN
jgi:hypothetical protein